MTDHTITQDEIDNHNYNSLSELIKGLGEGSYNLIIASEINITKNFTIDQTLNINVDGTLNIINGGMLNIDVDGTLNINDDGTLNINAGGTLNINGGMLNIGDGKIKYDKIIYIKGQIIRTKGLDKIIMKPETKDLQEKNDIYNSVLSSFGVSNPSVNSSSEYNEALFKQFKDLLDSELSDIDKSNTILPKQAITGEIERLKNNQEDNEDIDLNNLKEKINLLENNLSSIDTKIQKLILFSLINVKNI